MTDSIAADRWTIDQFLEKAREIRRRLQRWHESLPGSVGVDIHHKGQRVRIVPWHDHLATGRETFRSRLNAGHGQPRFVLVNPYVPGLAGPIESAGQYSSDQTEYVLRDFWEHLAGDPTLELLRIAYGRILDANVFAVHPLGIPKGETVAVGEAEPGKTPWIVSSVPIDPQILNEFVDAIETLALGPTARERKFYQEASRNDESRDSQVGSDLKAVAGQSIGDYTKKKKKKRSTERGEARAKLIATLTKHHQYADGGCLMLEPIASNELARQAKVAGSTASEFFSKEFNGHTKYRALCGDASRLLAALKLLNQEFSPRHLFGSKPPNEDNRDAEL